MPINKLGGDGHFKLGAKILHGLRECKQDLFVDVDVDDKSLVVVHQGELMNQLVDVFHTENCVIPFTPRYVSRPKGVSPQTRSKEGKIDSILPKKTRIAQTKY